jgi:hypothetical protein
MLEGKPLPALRRVHALAGRPHRPVTQGSLIDLYAADYTDQASVAMAVFPGHAEAVLGLGRPFAVTSSTITSGSRGRPSADTSQR